MEETRLHLPPFSSARGTNTAGLRDLCRELSRQPSGRKSVSRAPLSSRTGEKTADMAVRCLLVVLVSVLFGTPQVQGKDKPRKRCRSACERAPHNHDGARPVTCGSLSCLSASLIVTASTHY